MAFKIYTKTGDTGETGIFGGGRLSKHVTRIEAYGTIDEVNSHIGHLHDLIDHADLRSFLLVVQHKLFNIGSVLASSPDKVSEMPGIDESDIKAVEAEIDRMESELPPLRQFILPSGAPPASFCHIVRTVCRRAERRIVALHAEKPVQPVILQFVNRLSDYLFVLSRTLLHRAGKTDTTWNPDL